MKLILYDSTPQKHGINPHSFEPSQLCWLSPANIDQKDIISALVDADAVILHARDEQRYNHQVSEEAISRNLSLTLYSGEYSIALKRYHDLKRGHPSAMVCTLLVKDLNWTLQTALEKNDVGFLCWDRMADVLELLTSLWVVSLRWETNGHPGDGLIDQSGRLNYERLAEMTTVHTDHQRTINDLRRAIYGRNPKPDKNLDILNVSTPDEYQKCLGLLRESLLAWAQLDI